MTDHPIIPPPELKRQWREKLFTHLSPAATVAVQELIQLAAQWGADQELEACCEVLKDWGLCPSPDLRSARRPKPQSLKEQALKELDKVDILWDSTEFSQETLNSLFKISCETIRKALETLPDD